MAKGLKGILLLLEGKDSEAQVELDLHLARFPKAREFVDKKVEDAKNLRNSKGTK